MQSVDFEARCQTPGARDRGRRLARAHAPRLRERRTADDGDCHLRAVNSGRGLADSALRGRLRRCFTIRPGARLCRERAGASRVGESRERQMVARDGRGLSALDWLRLGRHRRSAFGFEVEGDTRVVDALRGERVFFESSRAARDGLRGRLDAPRRVVLSARGLLRPRHRLGHRGRLGDQFAARRARPRATGRAKALGARDARDRLRRHALARDSASAGRRRTRPTVRDSRDTHTHSVFFFHFS